MGHFSKFIPRGSRYLMTDVKGSTTYSGGDRGYGSCWPDDGLQAAAFLRPDGDVALVVLSCADEPTRFKISMGARATYWSIPGHSIQTYLIPLDHEDSSLQTSTGCRWMFG